MFEQSILSERKTRRPWTTGVAIVIEMAIVGVLLLVPYMYVQTLPMARSIACW